MPGGSTWVGCPRRPMSKTSPPFSAMRLQLWVVPLQAQVCLFSAFAVSHYQSLSGGIDIENLNLYAGPCVVNVYINYEKKFAFVELRTGKSSANSLP